VREVEAEAARLRVIVERRNVAMQQKAMLKLGVRLVTTNLRKTWRWR
jgi:hypothetical protein